MAMTPDQKKRLLIGGGVGAVALVAGYAWLSRKTHAAALPSPHAGRGHGHHRHGNHDGQGHDGQGERAVVEVEENQRGEYGHRKHKHRHHGEHEDGR